MPRSLLLLGLVACSTEPTCPDLAAVSLQTCVEEVGAQQASCYLESGTACADDDATIAASLAALEASVGGSCSDGEAGALAPEAYASRLSAACRDHAASMAWRAFGGPQGSALSASSEECLTAVHAASRDLASKTFDAVQSCLDDACEVTELQSERAALAAAARTVLEGSCGDLGSRIALGSETFVTHTHEQLDCLLATVHGDRGLALTCGPDHAEIAPPRGTWSEVVVDGEQWGTRCGDGSTYAFWIRPAPEGQPLDRVVVALQGGGVCLFEEDCGPRLAAAPGLFGARDPDDEPAAIGIASDDPEISPFHDWTMVYLPYCTQDVFAGGGVTEELGAVTVERYGSVNLRASVRIVRDWLWQELDAAGGDGYRPDELRALFGGFSAGGYGTLYNYHWMLDDLQWPRTTAFPDAGLAVDNGELLSVGSLGDVKIPAWGMQDYLPPYCFTGPCSGGETLLEALSPRLEQVPQQHMVLLSNQRDSTQAGDAFFSDDASFINGLRQMYCDTRELNGVHWYLTSVSDESLHVVSLRDELFTGEVDGAVMSQVLLDSVLGDDQHSSHVEEGDFVTAIEGVEPFPCELP